jgi:tetratricopeptide (TPR) repeat protein
MDRAARMTLRKFRLLFPYLLIQSILLSGSAPSLSAQGNNADSLRRAFATGIGDQANTLLLLSQAFEHTFPDSAVVYAMRMLNVANEKNEGKHIAAAQYQLGRLYTKLKKDTLAVRYLMQGLETARSLNDMALVIAGYIQLADYHLANGRPREAIDILHQTEEFAPDKQRPSLRKDLYAALGDAYKELSLYHDATDNYLKALRLTEEAQDVQGSARMFNSLGTVYHRTGDYVQALDYFDRALKINQRYNNKSGSMSNLLNIGVIHQKEEEYEQALSIYRQVLPLSRELRDAHTEAIAMGNIGSTLVEEGKLQEGLGYLNHALALKEPIHNVNSTLHTLNDIADVKVRLGDAAGAKAAAEKVVQLGEEHQLSDQLRYGYLNLSNSYKLLKDFRNAHHFLEKHNALNDSLFGIEKAEQINELQIRYDTERKDMAIQSLEQERRITDAQKRIYALAGGLVLVVLAALYVTQRTKARRNLALLEKEREVDRLKSDFFANISHEFRTPLSLILGPVETMLEKTQEPNQRFQLELMRKSAARLLRLINQILELSKLQFARPELKATKVNAVEIVKGITSTFQSLADSKGIDLVFQCQDDNISLFCDQEQIETVCMNLISNAFKFSDTAGKISVTLKALPSS